MVNTARASLMGIAMFALTNGCQSPDKSASPPVPSARSARSAAPSAVTPGDLPATGTPPAATPTMAAPTPTALPGQVAPSTVTPAPAVVGPQSAAPPATVAPLAAKPVMAVQRRPATAPATRPTLASAPASVDLILAGRKTSTTRAGVRHYPAGLATTGDGKRTMAIVITAIDAKPFADLTAADAATDGSASVAAYRAALAKSYPKLADADVVSVVHFRLAR